MDRNVAEELIAAIAKLDVAAGELGHVADSVDDANFRKKIKRLVAEAVLDVHEQITLEIVREYPDLHPDKDDPNASKLY